MENKKPIKVLNLYAGIGGNRKLWTNVEVTAVENDLQILKIYQDFFPNDKMIVGDAHQYLVDNYEGFDFIWSSPPCQSHSRIRNIAGVGSGQNKPIYPDMNLYQEIIFLNQITKTSGTKFNGKWVVENVKSYYNPLIRPQEIGRHFFWANFHITNLTIESGKIDKGISDMERRKGFNLKNIKLDQRKDQVLRNCVEPELGLHIFNCAFKDKQQVISEVV